MASARQPAACLWTSRDELFAGPGNLSPPEQRRFTPLAQESIRILSILAALLENSPRLAGPDFQSYLNQCLHNEIVTEDDLWAWLREEPDLNRLGRRAFDAVCLRTAKELAPRFWMASLHTAGLHGGTLFLCPHILIGRGPRALKAPGVAWFNSRKPRLLQPEAPWLQALRATLMEVKCLSGLFAASGGTLSYDLVSSFAVQHSLPLLRFMPDSLSSENVSEDGYSRLVDLPFVTTVTCQFGRPRCPKPTRWICRDRMLAHLAEAHIVLELRASSRLAQILAEQHEHSPRALWVFDGSSSGIQPSHGNQELLKRFAGHARAFPILESGHKDAKNARAVSSGPVVHSPLDTDWKDHLYHYTRSCPGPWPGEDIQAFHLSILRGDPSSAHTALDTLARILNEQRVRASHLLVRGRHPVVSLTSRPPPELDFFKRWNRSQARWTLEPFGIAIRKAVLRRMGAKPAIYGGESVFRALGPKERYRFQNSAGRISWVAEREWRLDKDLWLRDVPPEAYFVFVPSEADAERLATLVAGNFHCVIGGGSRGPKNG